MKNLTIVASLLLIPLLSHAQMVFETDSLYGNEWIDYNKTYYKFSIDQDGVYSIKYSDLVSNGIPENIKGEEFQLYSMGKEIPIFVSSENEFEADDNILFYAVKNRGELDQTLFEDWEKEQLNPAYSMFTENRSYFLSWETGSNNNKRINKIENELSGNLPPVENFYFHEETQVFNDYHLQPIINNADVRYSSFTTTEGFGTEPKSTSKVELECSKIFNGSPFANLSVRVGSSPYNDTYWTYFNNDFIESIIKNGKSVFDIEYQIQTSDLNNNNDFEIIGQGFNNKSTIAEITLSYPREFDAENKTFFRAPFSNHSFSKYFEIENFQTNGQKTFVLDPHNGVILDGVYEDEMVKFLLPNAVNDREIFLFTEAVSITQFLERKFVDYENISPEYVLLTSEFLDGPDDSGVNQIEEYKSFRNSTIGGSYNVEVVHAEDIIDQFGYGIEHHSIGLRNWANLYADKWQNWNFTFIIGKAHEYGLIKENPELVNHVPTWGEPGSDNLSFAKGKNTFPEMGIGRLAVTEKEQIGEYLNKQLIYLQTDNLQQSIEDRYWMKKIIHLNGGDPNSQTNIRESLDLMKDSIESSLFGADVITFSKTTTNAIETSISQKIVDEINDGSSIITFFGHSSVGILDFGISEPSDYDNEGKTPLIVSLGCSSGNIHTTAYGISENFVLAPEKGAIAFFASSGVAFIPEQGDHGLYFYELVGEEMYGLELGLIVKKMLKEKFNIDIPSTLQQQLTLHGDPAIRLSTYTTPDYTPDFSTFRTNPEVVSGRLDSFDVCFDIVNLGRYKEEDLSYYLIHSHGQTQDTFFYTVPGVYSRENLCHTIPINLNNSVGENIIEVYLDHEENIQELPAPQAEMNNSITGAYQIPGYSFFVLNDNPIPFYPSEFAITNEEQITLQASTGNGLVGKRKYTVEIDTTENFNSSEKQTTTVETQGGLIKWQPDIEYKDNQVYYWRVRLEDSEFDISYWNNSSFIHLDEYEHGWNQSHYFQFLKDELKDLGLDSTTRDFEFGQSTYEYEVFNVIRNVDNFSQFSVNSSFTEAHFFSDFQGGVFVAMINPSTFKPFVCPINGALGADNYVPDRPRNLWPFETNTAEDQQELIDFLTRPEFDDYYVIMFTVQSEFNDCNPENWSDEMFEVFENEGAMRIRELIGNPRPYVFAYQDGKGFLNESIADAPTDELTSTTTIVGKWYEGTMSSTTIGPAKTWNKFIWNLEHFESNEDLFDINLFGKKLDGSEDTLAANITNEEFDLSFVDVETYPYLRLDVYFKDTISLSSPSLDFWRVLYEPLPEAVFNATEDFVFQSDTLQRGEDLFLKYQIDNISTTSFDSMLVNYSIFDRQNNEVLKTSKKSPIGGKSSIQDEFTQNTMDMNGLYQLRVEVNPNMDQLEEHDFNNIGVINFLVRADDINPLLDVTFDGIRILDGDIISPRPLIKVSLTDENTLLLLNNSEDFQLVLLYPDGTEEEINIDDTSVNFIPAEEGQQSNTACIEFSPTLTEGKYTLIIQAKDATGNFSGDHAYTISFEVFEEDQITNVINYPNPFSTSTEFLFVLTGNKIPTNYHIKIMTLSGKVVREIDQTELGPIKVGLNRSQYKWDGTDEYGSRLANGVYFYKFYSDIKDELDHLEREGIDHFYKSGFGKLVIMR